MWVDKSRWLISKLALTGMAAFRERNSRDPAKRYYEGVSSFAPRVRGTVCAGVPDFSDRPSCLTISYVYFD